MAHGKFTMETLAQAMAPSKIVLDSFVGQNSLNSQHEFGVTIQNLWNMFGPSKRYLRGLLQKYIRMVEAEGHTIEDDELIAIIIHCNQIKDIYPDPSESCYLNFRVTTNRQTKDNDSLRLRIFPQHNDVSLRLWEAGAVLAEYFLKYPQHISGKAILEIGAGVGLTGLVAASYCGARKVVMTDYSSDCLLNLHHNIHINGVQDSTHISQAYLDWEVFLLDDPQKTETMRSILKFFDDEADVLIAADVAYDTALVPLLAKLVKRFLNMRGGRQVIFATTLRNQSTFQLFEDQLKYHSIKNKYEHTSVIDELPIVFPISFLQPRSDTRICSMILDNINDS